MRLRSRTVKPELWVDIKLRGIRHDYRLVLIGLWQACDDAGWGVWEPSELAAALFPYDPPEQREPLIIGAFTELRERELIKALRCGHFTVPSLPKHVWGGKDRRTATNRTAHEANDCPHPARRRGAPGRAGASRGMPGGKVREGKGGEGDTHARAPETPSNGSPSASVEELRRLIADPTSAEPARKAARKALERLGVAE